MRSKLPPPQSPYGGMYVVTYLFFFTIITCIAAALAILYFFPLQGP